MNLWRKWKRKIYGELIPTDKEIFEFVYEEYYLKFINYDREKNKTRITKNFVPIDISKRFQEIEIMIFKLLYLSHINAVITGWNKLLSKCMPEVYSPVILLI